ncbi:hypothetical protein Pgy4_40747, partial [Pseudomonas savastanoi pv. glycinea str. race 4]
IGGSGADTLIGGTGADRYVFNNSKEKRTQCQYEALR